MNAQVIFDTLDERGIRQDWLAERLGIKSARLSHYRTGRRAMPDEIVVKAAEILQLPESAIIGERVAA